MIDNTGSGLYRQDLPQTARAIAWFKEFGVESTLSACQINTGVGDRAVREARRALKNAGFLAETFSPNTPTRIPGAGTMTDPSLSGEVPSTLHAPPPRAAVPSPAPFSKRVPGAIITANSLEELDAAVSEEATRLDSMSPEEARREATALYYDSKSSQMKAMMLRILGAGSLVGASSELGPGLPLTLEARLHRAALILQACLRENAGEVWARAFNEKITAVEAIPLPPIDDEFEEAALPELTSGQAGAPTVMIEMGNAAQG